MSAVPIFRENMETRSILASNHVNMMAEIPDLQKAYIDQNASSITDAGVNFQMPNLNSWFVGEIEQVFTRKYVMRGTTVDPSYSGLAGTDSDSTSSYLWSEVNSTVDGFCLNKAVNEIKYNVGNKAWTESDRTNPEMIDIFQTQFNQDMVKSYGIYGEDGLSKSVEHDQSTVMGIPVKQPIDSSIISSTISMQSEYGRNDYYNRDSTMNQAMQQNNKGYVKVLSNTFTAHYWNGSAFVDAVIQTKYDIPGNVGIATPSLNGETAFYILPAFEQPEPLPPLVPVKLDATTMIPYVNGTYIEQTVELEIHEWIVSPHLSNPYSKNPHKKIYYTNGYPLNLTLSFNKDYVTNSLLKWQPARRLYNGLVTNVGDFTNAVQWKLQSRNWGSADQMRLRLWTFDTARPLPEVPVKTVYFKQNRQTPFLGKVSRTSNTVPYSKFSAQISTSNLSSLDPYIIVYASVSQQNNPAYFGKTSVQVSTPTITIEQTSRPYVEMMDIDSLEIKVGTQADTLGDCRTLPKSELVKMTLDVLGNPEARQLLEGTLHYNVSQSLGMQRGILNEIDQLQFSPNLASGRGFPFYIIDVAKLNLRQVDGLPLVPRVNYGNTNFKALTIKALFSATEQMNNTVEYIDGLTANVLELTCEYNVILMEQRIKTLPLFSGMMQDDKVEFNIDEFSAELLSTINGTPSDNGDNQLSYVGGAFAPWEFLKELMGNARSYLVNNRDHPLVKVPITTARFLRPFSGVANAVASTADILGLGKDGSKSRYSRA